MTIDRVSRRIELDASIGAEPENRGISSRFSAPNLLRTGGVSIASVALLVVALVAIMIGVLAAIAAGADAAMSVLVGYCSVISTLAACSISSMLRFHVAERGFPPKSPRKTSEAWKLVSTLTVADASRLWCEVEPGATTTQDTIAWGRALIDAIKCGELPIVRRSNASEDSIERERANPHYMTQVSRDALKSWAARHGYAPDFLAD
jgi:hypothetical protein